MKKSKKFEEFIHFTDDEYWDYCLKEYNSTNFISKKLINNFYKKLFFIINSISKSNQKVLEIGYGAAESSRRIYEFLISLDSNFCFEASEYDNRLVRKINKLNLPFKVLQEDVYNLNRNNNAFDIVIFLEVLEHLDNPKKAIKEIARVSKNYFIISVPNEPLWRFLNICRFKYISDFGNTPGHINHYNKKSLAELVSNYAQVVSIQFSLPWIFILAKK